MKEESKLIDAILDLALEIKGMRKEFNDEMKGMRMEQHKTNVLLAEHSRSIMTLADKLKVVVDHEKRISKLEKAML